MELWKQDALTALARFNQDCWDALPTTDRGRRMNDVRLAFDLWAEAPSQPAWDNFVVTLEAATDPDTASSLIADLEPYFRPKSS